VSDDGRQYCKSYDNEEPGTIYKHNKTDKLYRVIGFMKNCTNAQDEQTMVVYEAVDSPTDNGTFCREATEFREKFTAV
jgi:hypothetical protein